MEAVDDQEEDLLRSAHFTRSGEELSGKPSSLSYMADIAGHIQASAYRRAAFETRSDDSFIA